MTYFDVNWLAILLASVASMALGMVWYMLLAKQWLAATGRTMAEIKAAAPGATPFIWSGLCQLVTAYGLALLTPKIFGSTNISGALTLALIVWATFILTSMILNHRYQGRKWSLTLIDGGYLLGVVLLQGLVLGLFG